MAHTLRVNGAVVPHQTRPNGDDVEVELTFNEIAYFATAKTEYEALFEIKEQMEANNVTGITLTGAD